MTGLHNVLTAICLALVIAGMVPVATGLYQYLLIPLHVWRNHYRLAAGYEPNVAVVVPAWNEGAVIGTSIDRLVRLEYPPERLRIYVVDDASTDDTPGVVVGRAAQYPGQVFHLRRARGGQGKAHTLNHGIRLILDDDWAQAILIMDADVVYRPDSLRKLTRHLADPQVGAVTAYIREGSARPRMLTRFVGYEYVAAQCGARRAQNVLGALACLAGGAQLHSRANLEAIGGAVDTGTLAEDTVSTLLTQLDGRRVVFEPYAVVLAEEPDAVNALWKQRLRWARGNVQVTRRFAGIWFRPWRHRQLGGLSFGLIWFSVLLLPLTMVLSSTGLIGLYVLNEDLASAVFERTWFLAACTYLLITVMTVQLDGRVGRRSWREAICFPGLISLAVMVDAMLPGLLDERLPAVFGLRVTDLGEAILTLGEYGWLTFGMVAAWLVRAVELGPARRLVPALVYLVGYGPILCAVTVDAFVKEFRGAAQVWDKTEKVGRVMA